MLLEARPIRSRLAARVLEAIARKLLLLCRQADAEDPETARVPAIEEFKTFVATKFVSALTTVRATISL